MKAFRLRDDRPIVRTDNRRRRRAARYERERLLRNVLRRIRTMPAALVRAGDQLVEAVLDPSPAMNRRLWLVLIVLAAWVATLAIQAAMTVPRDPRPVSRPWTFGRADVVGRSDRLARADSRGVAIALDLRVVIQNHSEAGRGRGR